MAGCLLKWLYIVWTGMTQTHCALRFSNANTFVQNWVCGFLEVQNQVLFLVWVHIIALDMRDWAKLCVLTHSQWIFLRLSVYTAKTKYVMMQRMTSMENWTSMLLGRTYKNDVYAVCLFQVRHMSLKHPGTVTSAGLSTMCIRAYCLGLTIFVIWLFV